jgi:hypothetical protein
MRYITEATYESGYRILLTFDDGTRKRVDLAAHLVGAIFEPLREPRQFRTVRLDPDLDTIAWGNGADMAPEFLYEIGEAVAPATRALAVAESPGRYAARKPRKRRPAPPHV